MANSVETAKDLMTVVAGPSLLGTAALLTYAKKVFDAPERKPAKGWLAVLAGLALCAWMTVFVVWAAPTVVRSWTSDGEANATLALLSATWLVALGFILVLLVRFPTAARYLAEAYRTDQGPLPVRLLRRMFS
jgi:hypothetical protein